MKEVIVFKEWAPDNSSLNSPFLLEAKNVIPEADHFSAFNPLAQSINFTAPPARPLGGIVTHSISGNQIYAGDTTALWLAPNTGSPWTELSGATTFGLTSGDAWSFAQFKDLVIAAGSNANFRVLAATIGGGSSFATLSSSGEVPHASLVATFKDFVFALNSRSTTTSTLGPLLQWSAISDPRNWPTPNSATAIATQSGSQLFDYKNGLLTGMAGTDQFACIFQHTAITRMTYLGGGAVFQFDNISQEIGTAYPFGIVQVDNKIYFISATGIYMTDGVSVVNIGEGRVNGWILGASGLTAALYNGSPNKVSAAADPVKKLIYWGFPSAPGVPSTLLIYNYQQNKFTWAAQNHECLMSAKVDDDIYGDGSVYAFDADHSDRPSVFFGTPGNAVLSTGDLELNPMGRGYVSGIKPNVEASSSASVGVRVGYRNTLDSALTYTATTTPYSSTGVANFRVDAKYLKAEVNISGAFNKITGIEYDAIPSGEQ